MTVSQILFSLGLFSMVSLPAFGNVNCNEKVRKEIVKAASDRCGGKMKDGTWSENVYNVPADQSKMDLVFGFKCADGKFKNKSFLGLVNFSLKNECTVSKPQISHVNVLDEKPITE